MNDSIEHQEEFFEDEGTQGFEGEGYAPDLEDYVAGDGGESGEEVGIPGVDPNDIPEELMPQYKEMVRGMNAKFREIAEERKTLGSLKEKADTFDKILNDPEARKAFIGAVGAMDAGGEQSQNRGISFRPADAVDYSEVLEDEAVPAIQSLVGDYLDQVLGPQAQQIIASLQYLLEKDQGSEWEGIASKYDNASEYKAEVDKLLRQSPGLTREQALYAVAGDKLKKRQAATPKGKSAPRQKPVSLTKQSSVPASRTTPPMSKNDRRQNLVDYIKQLQSRSG